MVNALIYPPRARHTEAINHSTQPDLHMAQPFKGNYSFNKQIVSNWESNAIGVYYCGFESQQGRLICLYVGQAVGEGGIRGRLLQHLAENKLPDVSHFWYTICETVREAAALEAREILRLQPEHNTKGK